MVDIGNLIRIGRAKKNMSQADLAKKLGVVPSAISQWESGKKTPSGDTLIALAQILDIISDIFPGYVKSERAENHVDAVYAQMDNTTQKEIEEILQRLAKVEQYIGNNVRQVNNHNAVGIIGKVDVKGKK